MHESLTGSAAAQDDCTSCHKAGNARRRESTMKLRLPSPALVIACCALLIGAGGVAYGKTAEATGAMSSKSSKSKSFDRSVSVGNYFDSFTFAPILQTTATLAIDRLNVSIEDTRSNNWDGAFWYQTGDASTCTGPYTRIAVEAMAAGESHLDSFQQPLQLGPDAKGNVWCLKASFGPLAGSGGFQAFVDVSGSIVSGTLSPPIGEPSSHVPSSPTGK